MCLNLYRCNSLSISDGLFYVGKGSITCLTVRTTTDDDGRADLSKGYQATMKSGEEEVSGYRKDA